MAFSHPPLGHWPIPFGCFPSFPVPTIPNTGLSFDAANLLLQSASLQTNTVTPPARSEESSPSKSPKIFRPWMHSPKPSSRSPTHSISPVKPSRLAQLQQLAAQALYSDDESCKAELERLATTLSKELCGNIGYQCVFCAKIYSRKYGLKIHLRTHTGFKPLRCKFCNRPFGDPSNLNKHTRLHAEQPTAKCSTCNGVFATEEQLQKHNTFAHARK